MKNLIRLAAVWVMIFSFPGCNHSSKGNAQPGSATPTPVTGRGLDYRPANATCAAPKRLQTQGQIELQPMLAYVGDVSWPVDMVQPPNDPSKWYVIDREGTVMIYQDGDTFTPRGTFIDVRDRVQRNLFGKPQNEMGLLGMAFDPDFAVNGEFYLYYSADGSAPNGSGPVAARLSRFKSTDGGITASADSEEIIFSFDKDKPFHWGGRPAFGSDGYLYITLGEAGQPTQAQNVNSQWGKMLRIDVHHGSPYAIPPDNPFVGQDGLDEIYALGFRNPWRWSFDSLTGDIWLGDVGNALWEEVNLVTKGGNYGWRDMEGFECSFFTPDCDPTGYTLPITVYAHDDNAGPVGNAIIGGFIYRGALMPSMYGKYIYADVGGTIWAYDTATSQTELLLDSGNFILSIAESTDDRELYLLANQEIFKLKEANSAGDQGAFPQKLSETGCFDSGDPKIPGSMLIPYDVNVALWSDNAAKSRWLLVPDDKTIEVEEDGDWMFPVGTVLFKEFKLNNKRIETRMLVRHDDGGWAGYSYEWNDEQTEAFLLPPEGKVKTVGAQTWHYPSRSQCLGCHTAAAGRSLGLETAQLNKSIQYSASGVLANQLETLDSIGMFEQPLGATHDNLPALSPISDTAASLEQRARSYLHANCAMCHRPNGTGQGPEDFRWYLPLSEIGAVDVVPTQGNLGIDDARLLYPGRPDKSIMSFRTHTLDVSRMPPLGTVMVDEAGTQLIDDWIRSLGP